VIIIPLYADSTQLNAPVPCLNGKIPPLRELYVVF
jgi:hypothetical protein